MAHEDAKLLLERAENLLQRAEAIRTAISLGMPLHEIEAYLDWLDTIRPPLPPGRLDSRDSG
jgi:DNA-binding transcriptional MerR regulator